MPGSPALASLFHIRAEVESISPILDPAQHLRGLFFFLNLLILQLLTCLYLSSYTIYSHNEFG